VGAGCEGNIYVRRKKHFCLGKETVLSIIKNVSLSGFLSKDIEISLFLVSLLVLREKLPDSKVIFVSMGGKPGRETFFIIERTVSPPWR
jgi:hypothetical protein